MIKNKLKPRLIITSIILCSLYLETANAIEEKSVVALSGVAVEQKNPVDKTQQSSYALYKQEINKRFNGGEWEKNLTQLSERALMQEYVRMIGISNHLNSMNIEKKQKIEALLATYTSIQLQKKMK